jgi:NADPH-dependent glutamate synthase beta subunit-like oxidoreductase
MFHIFDDSADFSKLRMPVAVIGGGITAAHTVIKLSALYSGQVTLIKRHPFKVCDFDSDPGWLGPKYQKSYQRITDYSERREVIKKARNRGSLPSELFHKLRKLENEQTIKVADGEVTSVKQGENKELILSVDTQEVKVQSIVFATGFRPSRPGGSWLEKAIETFGLPCAKCGYPIVSQSLEWCRHLYVTGPLAELEIGPIARNISGARQAAERIVQSI